MKKSVLAGFLAGAVVFTAGCGGSGLPVPGGNYVFRVGNEKCSEKEAKILLMNYQKDYSSFYGIDMWEHEYEDGSSLEDYVKEMTVSRLAEVYTLDIIAEEQDVTLSEDEIAAAQAAAEEFVDGLGEGEQDYLGVSQSNVQSLYERFLLAQKLYTSLTGDISREVSDDEARVMDLKQICVSDENTAETLLAQLKEGADFSALAVSWNEAAVTDLQVSRMTCDTDVTDQIFALSTGTFSDVISMDGAYYIFYCVNAFNEEMTQENKDNVLTRRMEDAVASAYTSYTDQLASELNEAVWDDVAVDTSLELEGPSFLEVYSEHFGDAS